MHFTEHQIPDSKGSEGNLIMNRRQQPKGKINFNFKFPNSLDLSVESCMLNRSLKRGKSCIKRDSLHRILSLVSR